MTFIATTFSIETELPLGIPVAANILNAPYYDGGNTLRE
jgi:hypothetical protein